MHITYRKSTKDDITAVDALLKQCFGDRSKYGALDHIDDRYLLAFDKNILVAMTGIDSDSEFNGYEIDWTCTLRTYRHHGIITDMIRQCICECDKPIYCSCLRLQNSINLFYAMQELGFVCVIKDYKTYDSNHTAACEDCIHRTSQHCICHEDLYVKY